MKTKQKIRKTPRQSRRSPGRKWLFRCSLILLIWAILPFVANCIMGVGVILPAAVGAVGVIWGLCPSPDRKKPAKGWKRAMLTLVIVTACVVAVVGGLITGLMIRAAVTPPEEGATVVVLGSKIYGDRPSRMLRDRLNAAADYLEQHPTSNFVVSGGLGEGEACTEAYVMRKYLVEQRGIDPSRIA